MNYENVSFDSFEPLLFLGESKVKLTEKLPHKEDYLLHLFRQRK